MRWADLRPIQKKAIGEVLLQEHDLIVSARTAAGKTEAAFLPILSLLSGQPQNSVQALYVGPLKALINDQFRRLEDLCRHAKIPVHRWHGDVDQGRKRNLLEEPGGVLLITPESIESLFINHSTCLGKLFRFLRFVVLDELHAFVGRERGTHLRSLLFRIRQCTENDFRLVALSATLGDSLPLYADWMRPGNPDRVMHIHDSAEQKQVLYRIQAYLKANPDCRGTEDGHGNDQEQATLPEPIIEDMYTACAGRRNLVFANSRENVEVFADSLNEYCRQRGNLPEFLVHHGSLSKEIREHTEQLMRGVRPHTTVCSSTLELGIDIGNVAGIGQIGAAWSVSSLVQRLGRSGRKEGEPQVMRVFLLEEPTDADSDLIDRLHTDLLRAIALTELMLEKWVEPPRIDELDLSTLVQQILSVLAQTGGISAMSLYQSLAMDGAFHEIDQELFAGVLRSLASQDVIEQVPGGDLILAPNGESIVRHYSFYSAFATPVEYSVLYEGHPVGRLPAVSVPREREHLLLAGRRWEVVQVDHARQEIVVIPARGRKPPRFTGETGEIHPKVRQRMKEALLGDKAYAYLDPRATELLGHARRSASNARLNERAVLPVGDSCLWFTWTGTQIQRTLCLMAALLEIDAIDCDVAIRLNRDPESVVGAFGKLLEAPPTAARLAQEMPNKWLRKFDFLLAEPLLVKSLARDALDVGGACEVIYQTLKSSQVG